MRGVPWLSPLQGVPWLSPLHVLRAMRAKASHAAADGSGRAYTVVQEAAELTALRDN